MTPEQTSYYYQMYEYGDDIPERRRLNKNNRLGRGCLRYIRLSSEPVDGFERPLVEIHFDRLLPQRLYTITLNEIILKGKEEAIAEWEENVRRETPTVLNTVADIVIDTFKTYRPRAIDILCQQISDSALLRYNKNDFQEAIQNRPVNLEIDNHLDVWTIQYTLAKIEEYSLDKFSNHIRLQFKKKELERRRQ